MAKTKANNNIAHVDFKEVLLKEIIADPNQPRKFFDQASLDEMVDSIREKGVLQPVLLRPNSNGIGYMLVCGERRYRASVVVAGAFKSRDTIPAIIRELTDNEALELQIIENLQRKDVNPMEEATAFASLSQKFSAEEIAARVGKSTRFVTQRIKLAELIPDFQQMLFENKISLVDAQKASRFSTEIQLMIIEECCEDWKHEDGFEFESYWLNNNEQDLGRAPFDRNDKTLNPTMGSCVGCKFNSASSPLLFEDMTSAVCTNGLCFNIKKNAAFKKNIDTALADPSILFVSTRYYLEQGDKDEIKLAEEAGANVLLYNQYDKRNIEVDEMPDSYDVWLEDNYSIDDEETEEDRQKWIDLSKKEYVDYLVEFEEDKKRVSDELATGMVKKAFIINGSGKGGFVYVELRSTSPTSGNTGKNTDSDEISSIEQRETRNKELDGEKVWTGVRELLKLEDNQKAVFGTQELSYGEKQILLKAMKRAISYTSTKFIKDDSSFEHLARILIIDKLMNAYGSHIKPDSDNAAAYTLIKKYLPQEVSKIEIEQGEITAARVERVGKRIAALKKSPSTVN